MYLLDSLQMLYSYLIISCFIISNFQLHENVFEKEIKKEGCMESYVHLGKGPKRRKLPESCKIFREKWAGRGRKQDQEM